MFPNFVILFLIFKMINNILKFPKFIIENYRIGLYPGAINYPDNNLLKLNSVSERMQSWWLQLSLLKTESWTSLWGSSHRSDRPFGRTRAFSWRCRTRCRSLRFSGSDSTRPRCWSLQADTWSRRRLLWIRREPVLFTSVSSCLVGRAMDR